MTTNERLSPSSDNENDIDVLASQRVDGEISASEVSDELRQAVEDRAQEFAALRSHLLETAANHVVDPAQRERHIAAALSHHRVSRVPRVLTSPRILAGMAASFIVVGLVSVIGLSRTSPDAVMVAEQSRADMNAEMNMDINTGSPVTDGVGTGALIEGLNAAESEPPSADAPVPPFEFTGDPNEVVQFGRLEDFSVFVEAVDVEPMAADAESAVSAIDIVCRPDDVVPRLVRNGVFEGRRVQIHIFERGKFVVYDSTTCVEIVEQEVLR